MKKIPVYMMVLALLAINIANVAHANCSENTVCSKIQTLTSIDNAGDQHDEQQNAFCDCCATCGHHHHTHAFLSYVGAEHLASVSKTHHSWIGDSYFSQLHYPPSKPPKA